MGDALVDGLAEGLGDVHSPAVGLGEGLAVWLSSVVGEGSATGVSLVLSADDSDDDGCEAGDSTEGDGAVSSWRDDPVRASNVSLAEGVVVGSAGVSGSTDWLLPVMRTRLATHRMSVTAKRKPL